MTLRLAALQLLLFSCTLSRPVSAQLLELLPEGFRAYDLSGDGSVVAGTQRFINLDGIEAYSPSAWSPGDDFGEILVGGFGQNFVDNPIADIAISASGRTIVSTTYDAGASGHSPYHRPYLFSRDAEGVWKEGLPRLNALFTDVSDVGPTPVGGAEFNIGGSFSAGFQPAVFPGRTPQLIPNDNPFRPEVNGGFATAITPDGRYVVGYDTYNGFVYDPPTRGFRFDRETNDLEILPFLVLDFSTDGQTLVGYERRAAQDSLQDVGIWTKASGFQVVATLRDPLRVDDVIVSGDGAVLLINPSGQRDLTETFTFVAALGRDVMPLPDLLQRNSLDLAGWEGIKALGISHDGHTLIGEGFLDGEFRSWRAELTFVPEPSGSLISVAAALLGFAFRRRP